MKAFPIPVVGLGAGSHPDEDEAVFLPMPREMITFAQPSYHLEADPVTLESVKTLLQQFRAQMQQSPAEHKAPATLDLLNLPEKTVDLINETLGHGEVSIVAHNPDTYHIQETIFAGVWRIQALSEQGALRQDMLVADSIPKVAVQAAQLSSSASLLVPPPREGMMNAPAVVTELIDRSTRYEPNTPAHVINLTLLPMTPEDLDYLSEVLGVGAVTILSRGYGNCRITSTKLAHVWWVQYFNSMDQLILNTLEVVNVPEVACATTEDFNDSIERLGEWLATMEEEGCNV